MGRVQDKVALVTGGASGVGARRAVTGAEGRLRRMTDINEEAGQAFAARCGERRCSCATMWPARPTGVRHVRCSSALVRWISWSTTPAS